MVNPLVHRLPHLVMLHSHTNDDMCSDSDKHINKFRDSYRDTNSKVDSDIDIVGHSFFAESTRPSAACSAVACSST